MWFHVRSRSPMACTMPSISSFRTSDSRVAFILSVFSAPGA